MKRPVPPLIWANTKITTARAEGIISTTMQVINPPLVGIDVVNRAYLEGNITTNTYPRSVLYTSDPSGSIKGISRFTFNDITSTVLLDGNIDIISTSGSLNLSGGKITGLGTPIDPNDAATKDYVDTHSGGSGSATGPSLSVQYNSNGLFAGSSLFTFDETLGSLSIGSISIIGGGTGGGTDYSITGLSYPINATDAANKAYVDAATGSAPGLPFNSVQFNSAGVFGGSADLTYDGQTFYIANSTPSTGTTNGALVVSGGVGISGSLNVGTLMAGSSTLSSLDVVGSLIAGTSTLSALAITNDIQVSGSLVAGSSTLSSLDVVGTLIAGASTLNSLNVTSNAQITSNLRVLGNANSTDTSTGSLVISGGVGIAKDVFIGGMCHADEYLTTSDQRLKSSINRIDTDDVSKLLQLSGYTYYLKDHPDLKYGLMAQEIESAGLEHFVKNVGDHKKVNYQYFIPVLIESMKILKEQLIESDTKYSQLLDKLGSIENKLNF